MTYYIYKCENKKNGKIYIGCTKSIGGRIRQHVQASLKDNPVFHKAIQDDGITNFTWEIIDFAEYADDAFDKERYYIDLYNSFVPNGYNATTGGAGLRGYTGKRVVRLGLDGSFEKTYECANSTDRDGFNVGDVLKCCKGIRHTTKKKMFMFEEDYLKYGAKPYEKPSNAKPRPVVQCDLNGNKIEEFYSPAYASECTGTSKSAIFGCLSGRYKNANGFIWVEPKDYPIKDLSKYKKGSKGIKVAQLDVETEEVIAVYDSMTDAGKALGKNHRNIQKIIDIPGRTAYGYKWKKI